MGAKRSSSRIAHSYQVHLDMDHPTGNFWIDNGLVYLVNKLGLDIYSLDVILKTIQDELLQKTGNAGQYFDETTQQIKNYDKVTWVYPTGFFIKVVDTSVKKVKISGKEYPLSPPHPELKLKFSNTKKQCDICGEQEVVADAAMWIFPFVVAPDKFANFYSRGKRGIQLCPRCAVAGVAGYLSWLWLAQGGDTLHIFLFYGDLRSLKRLHEEVIYNLQVRESRGGNIKLPFYGPYLHETTMALILELFSHIKKSDKVSEEGRNILASLIGADKPVPVRPLTLYAISGNLGRTFNMQLFREFSQLHVLYKLYKEWLNILSSAENPQRSLNNIFGQFRTREGNKDNTLWRDKIAWAILEFGDPLPFVEFFLFDARAKEEDPHPLQWGTEEVLAYYAKEVLKVDENLLKVLKGFGYSLGNEAEQKKEMGLLYSLRNAKNLDEFLKVLNDIQFRLELTVPDKLVEVEEESKISGSPWFRVKTLLSIYAMNSFLRASRSSNLQKGGNIDEQ